MPLQKLQFKPGINRESTSYTNEGGWFDCDKVRFRAGFPEKIGGWTKYSDSTFVGTCRSLFPWTTLDGNNYVGVGTEKKYYIASGGQYLDITPLRDTQAAGSSAVIFTATNSSSTLTVTDADHGANVNDFVTFSGATALHGSGTVTAAILNAEHQITNIVNNNQYQIVVSVTANSNDAGGTGGANIKAEYQLNVGLDTVLLGSGWGAGIWNGIDKNIKTTTLNASGESDANKIANNDTSIVFADATGFADADVVDIGGELILLAGKSSNTFGSCTRGHGGTTAAEHSHGAIIRLAKGNDVASDDYVTLINDGSHMLVGATTVTVDATASFADTGYLKIENEILQYTTKTSTVFGSGSANLARGLAGTSAAQHNDNVAVFEASKGWGMFADTTIPGEQLRIWSVDNFGEDLIINVRDGDIYYWDATKGTSYRAQKLSDLSGSNKAPTVARFVVTSDIDRHILFFGCDSEASSGVQDPLLIRFGSQESVTEFETKATNTAGELRIGTGSEIVAVQQTKQQILIWTDISLHTVQYIGPPYTFGLQEISRSITIIGPNAATAVNDIVFWMGKREFYSYSGQVQKLPCTVKDFIFSDFNYDQEEKVFAGNNSSHGEVWWFYCSASSTTNNKYVVFNYEQNVWYYGNIARTAWIDRGTSIYPIAAGTDNYLYYHENGHDDGSTSPNTALAAHIESSQIDIGDGEQFLFARRVIPDITFRDSTSSTPTATFTIKARDFPGATYANTSSGDTEQSASSPIELFTNQIHTRIRGRSFAVRVESSNAGTSWRLGTPRVDLRPDGRR